MSQFESLSFVTKGLVTPRDYGFFFSENHVNKKILNFFFVLRFFLFSVTLKNRKSDCQIFTYSECKDDLTGLFAYQPITAVTLSTAPACRPRAPYAGVPTICPCA